METRGNEAKVSFVEKRICGKCNFWDRMKKLKYLNWDHLCKSVNIKDNSKEIQMKSSTSFISRLLVIANYERTVDVQEAISTYEFQNVNHMLMNPDGSVIPANKKAS